MDFPYFHWNFNNLPVARCSQGRWNFTGSGSACYSIRLYDFCLLNYLNNPLKNRKKKKVLRMMSSQMTWNRGLLDPKHKPFRKEEQSAAQKPESTVVLSRRCGGAWRFHLIYRNRVRISFQGSRFLSWFWFSLLFRPAKNQGKWEFIAESDVAMSFIRGPEKRLVGPCNLRCCVETRTWQSYHHQGQLSAFSVIQNEKLSSSLPIRNMRCAYRIGCRNGNWFRNHF